MCFNLCIFQLLAVFQERNPVVNFMDPELSSSQCISLQVLCHLAIWKLSKYTRSKSLTNIIKAGAQYQPWGAQVHAPLQWKRQQPTYSGHLPGFFIHAATICHLTEPLWKLLHTTAIAFSSMSLPVTFKVPISLVTHDFSNQPHTCSRD